MRRVRHIYPAQVWAALNTYRSGQSTPPVRSVRRDRARLTWQAAGPHRVAHMWAAPGAPRSQRAEHANVPLARRLCPRLPCRRKPAPGPSVGRLQRVAIEASQARPRPRSVRATPLPPPATPALGGLCVGSDQRVADAASRARPRAVACDVMTPTSHSRRRACAGPSVCSTQRGAIATSRAYDWTAEQVVGLRRMNRARVSSGVSDHSEPSTSREARVTRLPRPACHGRRRACT
jgi:hypothetical protein